MKVTMPCEFVTARNPADKQGGAAGTETVTPGIGLPVLSTTLMLIVTFGGQTAEVMVVTIVEVSAVVAADTVETIVDVKVVENIPPNGANLRIVDNGFVGKLPIP